MAATTPGRGTLAAMTSLTHASQSREKERIDVRWSALSDSQDGATIQCKTPQEILHLYGSYLTQSERTELLAMQEIWYLGLQNQAQGLYNNGYDDEDENYIPVKHEHLNFRYEVLETIGFGGQGIVVKCLDHRTNSLVAVKILGIPVSAYDANLQRREIEIGNQVQAWDTDDSNIIKMLDWFEFRKHYTIVLELLSGTLDDLNRRRNAEPLRMEEVKIFTKGILKCLSHLQAKKIIHGDLKPENILVKDRVAGTMKVTDFGHSFVEGCQTAMTFGTLMFMAPEGHLGYSSTCSADMWALGCTVVEIVTGKAIFDPMNFDDQLVCCMEVLGLPPDDLVKAAPRGNEYFESDKQPKMFGCIRVPGSRPLCMLLAKYGPEFVDFISSCLQWIPALRMTPEQALAHKWLQDIGTGEPGQPEAAAVKTTAATITAIAAATTVTTSTITTTTAGITTTYTTPATVTITATITIVATADLGPVSLFDRESDETSAAAVERSTPAQPSLTSASAEKTEIAEESMEEMTELVEEEGEVEGKEEEGEVEGKEEEGEVEGKEEGEVEGKEEGEVEVKEEGEVEGKEEEGEVEGKEEGEVEGKEEEEEKLGKTEEKTEIAEESMEEKTELVEEEGEVEGKEEGEVEGKEEEGEVEGKEEGEVEGKEEEGEVEVKEEGEVEGKEEEGEVEGKEEGEVEGKEEEEEKLGKTEEKTEIAEESMEEKTELVEEEGEVEGKEEEGEVEGKEEGEVEGKKEEGEVEGKEEGEVEGKEEEEEKLGKTEEKTEIAEESMEEKTELVEEEGEVEGKEEEGEVEGKKEEGEVEGKEEEEEKLGKTEEKTEAKTELLVQETREQKKQKRSRLARVGRAICSFFRCRLLCGGVSTAE
ncbi:unnamed protein product [Lampetra planeri]